MKPSLIVFAALVASPAAATADTLTQAIGYAITGHDNAQVRTVDRKNCVFAIGDETYFLNNVQTDRLKVETWTKSTPRGDVFDHYTVALHGGDAKVWERKTVEAPLREETLDPKFTAELKRSMPDVFTKKPPVRESSNELHPHIADTADLDRVNRAWAYIYANGCTGRKSPF